MFGFRQSIDYEQSKCAKTMKAEELPAELRAGVHRKIFKANTKNFTNWEFKIYGSDVLDYICDVIKVEVIAKELCQKEQTKLAWNIIYEVLIDMLDCLHGKHDRRTHILESGWGYFQCNDTLKHLEKVLLTVLKATKVAGDRHNPDNNFVKHAEMLELFKGLEPYGYELDGELKGILDIASELRVLASDQSDVVTTTSDVAAAVSTETEKAVPEIVNETQHATVTSATASEAENLLEDLRAAVRNKIFNANTKNFTNWEFKNYGSDVLDYICEVIKVEIIKKELCQKEQTKLAWNIIYEVLIDMLDCLHGKHDRRTHILESGWGYFQCNDTLKHLEKVLVAVLKGTKIASDRHNPDNNFVKHAEMLELFKGLEPYGYELDGDLKGILDIAAELRVLATGHDVVVATTSDIDAAVSTETEKTVLRVVDESQHETTTAAQSKPEIQPVVEVKKADVHEEVEVVSKRRKLQ